MNRFLREPLLHFVLLGGLLFAAYGLLHRQNGDSGEIVVTRGQIERLVATFAGTWQRPPSPDELKGLIDQHVREEVYSREAVKLGLDRNDVIIRRRLQQKMEFIADDLAALTEPTEADLARYLEEHSASFRRDRQITFRQVFLNPEKHGDRLDVVATKLLSELRALGATADPARFGDPTLLEPAFQMEPEARIETSFGTAFAESLAKLPVVAWSGPVVSTYGTHLVFVDARTEGRALALAEVRDQVRREWQEARRQEANQKFFAELLEQYEVRIEWPESTENASARP